MRLQMMTWMIRLRIWKRMMTFLPRISQETSSMYETFKIKDDFRMRLFIDGNMHDSLHKLLTVVDLEGSLFCQ